MAAGHFKKNNQSMQKVTAFFAVTFAVLILAVSFGFAQTAKKNTPPVGVQRQNKIDIKPTIPKARRNPSLVFLEHADELLRREGEPYMVVTGNVQFSKGGMKMFTDSAHYFEETGSFDAFGNVHMEQGDTLFIFGDELNYDGKTEVAVLFGYNGKPVRLIDRKVKLETDIFTYDLYEELGYYTTGGTLSDGQNRLVSQRGEYSPNTKEAIFRDNVVLTSQRPNDELRLVNEALFYNTLSHIAEFHVPTTITNKDGVIKSDDGRYNTETRIAELFKHSVVTTTRGSTLEGDTLFYDRATGIGEAWGNMALVDTVKSSILYGDYGFYNEIIDSAFVTGHAQAMEFSKGDTLYIHGKYLFSVLRVDTLTRVVARDTIYFENEPADALDSPVEGNLVTINDSLSSGKNGINEISNLTVSDIFDSEHSSETSSELAQNSKPTLNFRIEERTEQYVDSTHVISAWPRVRMYRTDAQGLCDSLVFTQADSMVHMYYHPIVWSEDRQIFGNVIQLHVNDTTVESATLPDFGFMAQHIEDQFYNQLTGKVMKAWFDDGQLTRMLVEGSVEGIMYPEEADSTINKLVNFQTANLEAFFENQNVKRMKLWPQTSGEAIPLYLAKYNDLTLSKFKWYTGLRPTSPADIFNVSPEMDELMSDHRLPSPPYIPRLSGASTPPPDENDDSDAVEEESDSDAVSSPESTERIQTQSVKPDAPAEMQSE